MFCCLLDTDICRFHVTVSGNKLISVKFIPTYSWIVCVCVCVLCAQKKKTRHVKKLIKNVRAHLFPSRLYLINAIIIYPIKQMKYPVKVCRSWNPLSALVLSFCCFDMNLINFAARWLTLININTYYVYSTRFTNVTILRRSMTYE